MAYRYDKDGYFIGGVKDGLESEYPRLTDVAPDLSYGFIPRWNGSEWEYIQVENDAEVLRRRREEECFPYINRGGLWYARLSEQQIIELSQWYEAWLDVTKTKVIPERPAWLE